jgi:cysteine-rich CPXCG protein
VGAFGASRFLCLATAKAFNREGRREKHAQSNCDFSAEEREPSCETFGDNCGMEAGFQCAGCGEWNVTTVDEFAGRRQRYIEDCQVCCKPNVLRVEYDASVQEFSIGAELE